MKRTGAFFSCLAVMGSFPAVAAEESRDPAITRHKRNVYEHKRALYGYGDDLRIHVGEGLSIGVDNGDWRLRQTHKADDNAPPPEHCPPYLDITGACQPSEKYRRKIDRTLE